MPRMNLCNGTVSMLLVARGYSAAATVCSDGEKCSVSYVAQTRNMSGSVVQAYSAAFKVICGLSLCTIFLVCGGDDIGDYN